MNEAQKSVLLVNNESASERAEDQHRIQIDPLSESIEPDTQSLIAKRHSAAFRTTLGTLVVRMLFIPW
jgi:hypothetical protein